MRCLRQLQKFMDALPSVVDTKLRYFQTDAALALLMPTCQLKARCARAGKNEAFARSYSNLAVN